MYVTILNIGWEIQNVVSFSKINSYEIFLFKIQEISGFCVYGEIILQLIR